MFEWSDLRYFLAVARAGSTLAAARMLGTSQSTVHRRLMELESRIGRKLVKRSTAGYELTELGVRLLADAERVEDAIAAFERRAVAADQNLTGSVRVTCSSTMAERLASILADTGLPFALSRTSRRVRRHRQIPRPFERRGGHRDPDGRGRG